jgi:uncharacterized membrane protein
MCSACSVKNNGRIGNLKAAVCNKMGINDVINMLSINNTHANLWHQKLIKRNLNFNEWMHKLKKLKTKSCVRLIHSLLFIFSLMLCITEDR